MTEPTGKRPAPGSPEALALWLAWLKTSDCPCDHRWGNQGTLYGVSEGKGWSRTSTEPECPHHGTEAQAEWDRRHGRYS